MQSIASFIRSQPTKVFMKNEPLLQQGEVPNAVYAIRSGLVKLSDISADGYEQVLWFAKKYDVVPLEWLFEDSTESPFFYTAHSETEVFVIPKKAFLEHIDHDPSARTEINKAISAKQRQLLQHISATLKPKARDKISHILYYLALRFADNPNTHSTTIPLTHQTIANLVGITRETASLELKQLRDEGYIDYEKQHVLIHRQKLEEIVDACD